MPVEKGGVLGTSVVQYGSTYIVVGPDTEMLRHYLWFLVHAILELPVKAENDED